MIDAALRHAYLTTRYDVAVGDSRITLEIGRPAPALDRLLIASSVAGAAFVTAWNPRSVWLSQADNLRRADALAAAVATLGLDALPVTTVVDDPRWIEQGLLILGISETQARRLGAQFAQNAIVIVTRGGVPELIELVSPGEAS